MIPLSDPAPATESLVPLFAPPLAVPFGFAVALVTP